MQAKTANIRAQQTGQVAGAGRSWDVYAAGENSQFIGGPPETTVGDF
jgi:hypothetical protein